MLSKCLMFSDIHWGRKNNSTIHNNDCMNYIDWMIERFEEESCDHIVFLGDWFEQRNAINSATLQISHEALEKLSSLDVPVYIIVGNHDMYQRHSREVYATSYFRSVKNINIIDTPTIVKELGNGVLLSPFLFHDEYESLKEFKKIPVWMGHFEFNDFIVTGNTVKMTNGNPIDVTKNIRRVFSGHFHKRQIKSNICYIGNTFPMDFSDANDFERGCAIYEYSTDNLTFKNWDNAPKYTIVNLSDVIENSDIKIDGTVKCVVDIDLNFEDSVEIKRKFLMNESIRDFYYIDERVQETFKALEVENIDKMLDINHQISSMLSQIQSSEIMSEKLVKIYNEV